MDLTTAIVKLAPDLVLLVSIGVLAWITRNEMRDAKAYHAACASAVEEISSALDDLDDDTVGEGRMPDARDYHALRASLVVIRSRLLGRMATAGT